MGEIAERIGTYRRVALDTPVFIYSFENEPTFSLVAGEVFSAIENGRAAGVTSVLSLSEISVYPHAQGNPELARVYELRLFGFPNLSVQSVDRRIARTAAWIRGEHGFRLPDAVHLATALEFGADSFITNDRRLRQFVDLPVLLLSDFIH